MSAKVQRTIKTHFNYSNLRDKSYKNMHRRYVCRTHTLPIEELVGKIHPMEMEMEGKQGHCTYFRQN